MRVSGGTCLIIKRRKPALKTYQLNIIHPTTNNRTDPPGHAYYFLEDVYPRMTNGRRPLKTPAILRALFPAEPPIQVAAAGGGGDDGDEEELERRRQQQRDAEARWQRQQLEQQRERQLQAAAEAAAAGGGGGGGGAAPGLHED